MLDIRGQEIGMIFQDPMSSLNPVATVEKQIVEVLRPTPRSAAARRGRGCSSCSSRSACPTPSAGSTPIRTSSPAACASG